MGVPLYRWIVFVFGKMPWLKRMIYVGVLRKPPYNVYIRYDIFFGIPCIIWMAWMDLPGEYLWGYHPGGC